MVDSEDRNGITQRNIAKTLPADHYWDKCVNKTQRFMMGGTNQLKILFTLLLSLAFLCYSIKQDLNTFFRYIAVQNWERYVLTAQMTHGMRAITSMYLTTSNMLTPFGSPILKICRVFLFSSGEQNIYAVSWEVSKFPNF